MCFQVALLLPNGQKKKQLMQLCCNTCTITAVKGKLNTQLRRYNNRCYFVTNKEILNEKSAQN